MSRTTSTPPATSPREPRNTRADILAAAHAILAATGNDDAITLRAVARGAGITAPAVYGHFADRYEILRTVVEATFAELAEAMGTAAAGHRDPTRRLRAVCRAYLGFATDRPHHYRVLFERHRTAAAGNLAGTVVPNTDVRVMVGADAFGVLLDATAACISSGASAAREAETTTTRIWVGLHGQATLQAALPWHPWPDRDRLADDILTRLADLAPVRRGRGG